MGSSPWQIIWKVLIPEALPTLVLGLTITTVNLIGYSAMAGAIGGGGLGDLAIRYGYQRFRADVMIQTVVVLVIWSRPCRCWVIGPAGSCRNAKPRIIEEDDHA